LILLFTFFGFFTPFLIHQSRHFELFSIQHQTSVQKLNLTCKITTQANKNKITKQTKKKKLCKTQTPKPIK